MQIRLTRKLASYLDGIDLSDAREGDVIELPRREAELLIAERWALPYRGPAHREMRRMSASAVRAVAADAPSRAQAVSQLRGIRERMDNNEFAGHDGRRAEDRFRDELYDSRARTIRSDKAHE
jgi:hypothetical protein